MSRLKIVRALAATTALGLAAIAVPLQAQTFVAVAAPVAAADQGSADIQRVLARLSALGYQDVREVERKSDKLYEVKARDAQGRRVELYLDPRSGEVLQSELKRRKWHD